MNCKETEKLILPFLKDEIDLKTLKGFMEHIKECESCKEELNIQYLVEKGLEHLEDGNTFDLQRELKNIIIAAEIRLRRREIALNIFRYILFLLGACTLIALLVGVLV